MHRKFTFFLAFLGLLALAAGCAPPMAAPGQPAPLASPLSAPAPTTTAGPLQLTILHTNDTWGYFLPCG